MKDLDKHIIEMISNEIKSITVHEPTPITADENNIMLNVLEEYLPFERNGGWIQYDLERRKLIYPKAFDELKKYMRKN
ncbi:hypothetical protein [Lacrimispora xylanisolvens]|uniref:hypothetical protein n=1 Tax=Lacrimispora xylanisolvens TaxID=384636 RepID=UPI0011B08611|nr:hypothetical protein [Hungatella xylanolytica]